MDDSMEMEAEDSDSEYAFESAHLALRGNKDYCDMLKYIVLLEAKKMQALQDLEDLSLAKYEALNDPLKFLEDLKTGTVSFPARQNVPNMPNIDWNAYGINIEDFNESMKKNMNDLDDCPKVRGRKFTDNKPLTFNQLWSCEEQKRLEELLETYPEEPVEANRYKKIAKALGTRTPVQVMSRIQKYFAKLAKAGLPIPGKTPRGINQEGKSILYKKSTFFPQLHVPVKMEDMFDYDSTETLPADSQDSSKYILGLLKAAKEQRLLDETTPVYQTKTVCVGCHKQGFLGARWTDNAGTDYCTDCIVKLLPAEKLIPIRNPL